VFAIVHSGAIFLSRLKLRIYNDIVDDLTVEVLDSVPSAKPLLESEDKGQEEESQHGTAVT